MANNSKFNIFNILEKDDKELIHSSFIKFLLTENNSLYEYLELGNIKFNEPVLEKVYLSSTEANNTKRYRIDIEVKSSDDTKILIIENKFKSFPDQKQLESYNELYNQQHEGKEFHKILFCFDPSIISFDKNGWKVIGYKDLLEFIKKYYIDNNTYKNNDKHIFVTHYYDFLNNYYTIYSDLKNKNFKEIFNEKTNRNNFWRRLFYSALKIKLDCNIIESIIDLDKGNVSEPLLNIIPKNWKINNNKELLIQLQGTNLKFYAHFNCPTIINSIIEISKNTENNPFELKYKKNSSLNAKTVYIFKTELKDNDPITIEIFCEKICDFYKYVSVIVEEYKRLNPFP